MIIDTQILDELTAKAKESPRLRVAMDLRNSPDDQSRRMLNALEPGTVMPIHRHKGSSETCVCVRGHFEEFSTIPRDGSRRPSTWFPAVVIERSQWRSLKSLESGTVLLEAKEGAWRELGEEVLRNCDILVPRLGAG